MVIEIQLIVIYYALTVPLLENNAFYGVLAVRKFRHFTEEKDFHHRRGQTLSTSKSRGQQSVSRRLSEQHHCQHRDHGDQENQGKDDTSR